MNINNAKINILINKNSIKERELLESLGFIDSKL